MNQTKTKIKLGYLVIFCCFDFLASRPGGQRTLNLKDSGVKILTTQAQDFLYPTDTNLRVSKSKVVGFHI